jgi:hypothetical protein
MTTTGRASAWSLLPHARSRCPPITPALGTHHKWLIGLGMGPVRENGARSPFRTRRACEDLAVGAELVILSSGRAVGRGILNIVKRLGLWVVHAQGRV